MYTFKKQKNKKKLKTDYFLILTIDLQITKLHYVTIFFNLSQIKL